MRLTHPTLTPGIVIGSRDDGRPIYAIGGAEDNPPSAPQVDYVTAPAANIPAAPSIPYTGQAPAPTHSPAPSPANMPQYRPPAHQDPSDGWGDDTPAPAPAPRRRGRTRRADPDTDAGYDDAGYDDPSDDVGRDELPRDVLAKQIRRLRDENASHRVRVRDSDERFSGLRNTIAEALDIAPDDVTSESVADILGVAADETRATHIERRAMRAAYAAGADVDMLMDSSSFTRGLDALDPFADDFDANLSDLIESTLDANPRFALSPAGQGQAPAAVPARSGAEIPGGSGNRQPITRADLDRMSPEEINEARLRGELNHLL